MLFTFYKCKMLSKLLKLPCYSGSFFSCLITMHLFKMGSVRDLTFLNKMFLIYFAIETIVGWEEGNHLIRLREERYLEQDQKIIYLLVPLSTQFCNQMLQINDRFFL